MLFADIPCLLTCQRFGLQDPCGSDFGRREPTCHGRVGFAPWQLLQVHSVTVKIGFWGHFLGYQGSTREI